MRIIEKAFDRVDKGVNSRDNYLTVVIAGVSFDHTAMQELIGEALGKGECYVTDPNPDLVEDLNAALEAAGLDEIEVYSMEAGAFLRQLRDRIHILYLFDASWETFKLGATRVPPFGVILLESVRPTTLQMAERAGWRVEDIEGRVQLLCRAA